MAKIADREELGIALRDFLRAALLFRGEEKWKDAGNTFAALAQFYASLGKKEKEESAKHYVNAANCYKKIDPMKAVGFLEGAIIRYKELGFLGQAAEHHRTIAEIYEERSKNT